MKTALTIITFIIVAVNIGMIYKVINLHRDEINFLYELHEREKVEQLSQKQAVESIIKVLNAQSPQSVKKHKRKLKDQWGRNWGEKL